MVDVTTTIADSGTMKLWSVPPQQERTWTSIPLAEILYEGTQLVPAKLAADESLLALTLNLPRNNVYRIVEARAWAQSSALSIFNDWAPAVNVLVDPNLVGATGAGTWEFTLDAAPHAPARAAYPFAFSSVTNNWTSEFLPAARSVIDSPFQAADGGRIYIRWADISTDVTAATVFHWRFRCLAYTQEQYDKFGMNSPVPVL